jgi:flagellar biosynthesis protein
VVAAGGRCEDQGPPATVLGSADVARQIVAIAREYGIPLDDDDDLPHILERLDIGETIPAELYAIVSEVLAFAYAINGAYLDL